MLLEIGYDILFFWIVWMVKLGFKFIGQLFFIEVFFYVMVCDVYGRKMSKFFGNVIDFVDVIKGVFLEVNGVFFFGFELNLSYRFSLIGVVF